MTSFCALLTSVSALVCKNDKASWREEPRQTIIINLSSKLLNANMHPKKLLTQMQIQMEFWSCLNKILRKIQNKNKRFSYIPAFKDICLLDPGLCPTLCHYQVKCKLFACASVLSCWTKTKREQYTTLSSLMGITSAGYITNQSQVTDNSNQKQQL